MEWRLLESTNDHPNTFTNRNFLNPLHRVCRGAWYIRICESDTTQEYQCEHNFSINNNTLVKVREGEVIYSIETQQNHDKYLEIIDARN